MKVNPARGTAWKMRLQDPSALHAPTWNTRKSAHGPWRLSKTPALAIALPLRFFETMGLPCLAPR